MSRAKPDLSPWPLGEPIPVSCTIFEVCRIARMKLARFHQLKRAKALPYYIKQLDGTNAGTRPLYCGKTLAAWVAGEVVIHRTRRVA